MKKRNLSLLIAAGALAAAAIVIASTVEVGTLKTDTAKVGVITPHPTLYKGNSPDPISVTGDLTIGGNLTVTGEVNLNGGARWLNPSGDLKQGNFTSTP